MKEIGGNVGRNWGGNVGRNFEIGMREMWENVGISNCGEEMFSLM